MEGTHDEFKWFGEGFDGFPKTLSEDCVQYTIYFLNPKLRDLEVREKLREIQIAAEKMTKTLLRDFIWQREGFKLSIEHEKGRSLLKGQTSYGDSVEDEWLIVYILRELSKQFGDIWIQLLDSDGQFLLIEAANSLPLWLNPEVADNRVWINDGRLLIIPIEKPGGKARRTQAASDTLNVDTALEIIEKATAKMLHSTKIESEAFYRLQKYPQQIADSLHHSLIKVPRKLAYILRENPAYINPAVEAFYLRDPIALRPLQAKVGSKLVFPPEDLVTISVKFNKVGYAQLKSQLFAPPPTWSCVSMVKGDGKAKARAEMGMKVACGFEMLLSDPQNGDKQVYREISMLLEDVEAGDVCLPTEDDIAKWGLREDDENWLDVNFEDFEKELSKERTPNKPSGGFGDQRVQENLQKMVSRFEDFLEDDDAGADGAELIDEMDDDDDSSEISESEESENDRGEVKELSFDEDEFTAMMREMMGMPPDVMNELMGKAKNIQANKQVKPVAPRSDGSSSVRDPSAGQLASKSTVQEQEDEEISRSMDRIEQELHEAGALDFDLQSRSGAKSLLQERAIEPDSSSHDDAGSQAKREDSANHGVPDADANLVRNMLESFKSQGGAAGPGGNLLGLMGMHLPRDEHCEE